MSKPIGKRAFAAASRQRGAALVVGLIMLTLITLLVTSSFTLSTTSLQSVGNMQNRDEAISAANKAIEQIIDSPFTAAPAGEVIDVDIDNDGGSDYTVVFNAPTCVSAERIAAETIPPSSLSLGGFFTSAVSNYYQTVWDLDANVVHIPSGTSVRVREGVRVLLSQLEYDAVCS